jgi:predicted nucleic acid-binding protein
VIFLLDTTVIVAALTRSHEAHPRSLRWVQRAHKADTAVIATHGLAEVFSVLTTLPLQPRLAPATAVELIRENILRRFRIVPLLARDYSVVIRRMASAGLSGGIIYDALHARAAEKARVDRLVTLNPAHFERLTGLFTVAVSAP